MEMDKGPQPNRVVYLSYAPEDQALAEELKERFAARDYPEPDFHFPKPVYSHAWSMNATMNHLRIEDAACVVLIYTEHTNGFDMIVRDLEDAKKQGKPIFPLWLSDAPISPELEELVDTENHQVKATCLTKNELIAQLGAYELMKCIFNI
jgi:hypothetical protein